MKRKGYLMPAVLSLFSALVLVLGTLWLRQMAQERINGERKQQLRELTAQLSDTFGNALAFNRAGVGTAANLFAGGEYASEEDITAAAAQLGQIILNEEEGEDSIFFLLGEDGVCYDGSGERGIWGDFDQIAGMDEYCTFIADSPTWEGVYWAFVRRLEEPVTTLDGSVTIRYAVLLRTVESISRYYMSRAYEDVCEVYILKENGTRMYDSLTPEDTISSYNIYKALSETHSRYEESFEEVQEELAQNGVACGNYESGGTEYCYSLASQNGYQCVLLFLIPAHSVAVNTVSMVAAMMWAFVISGAAMIALVLLSIIAFLRLANSRRIAELKEQNLQKLQEANAQLENANRSLARANQAAQSALDIARSANRAKSSFLSNMSHDIRTPLNAIIGFLQLLNRDADDPAKVRMYSEKIQVSSSHLLSLINDILDMSRIESGKTTLNEKTFSVGSLISEIQAIIGPQAKDKKLNLTVDITDTAELEVRGDKLRLSQILLNLLSNAVKYTPEGGDVALTVCRYGRQTARMVTLRFVVKDNGIGMSSSFQKRLFEPFEREQNSTVSRVPGTGLGMAITKNLVDLMGGIILVDSLPGEGSTFTLELSLSLAVGEEEEAGTDGAETEKLVCAVDPKILEGKHFLVAEDNEINAEIIVELFSSEGATCVVARNGAEALTAFCDSEPGTYDAIFMDIQMPVMDGYESAQRIRICGHPDAMSIPIAAMTANAFAEDVQKALQSGMNSHIPKPVDMEKVKEFIAGEQEKKSRAAHQ